MELPTIEAIKKQAGLLVVPAYTAAYFHQFGVSGLPSTLANLANSETIWHQFLGYSSGFLILSASSMLALSIYHWLCKYILIYLGISYVSITFGLTLISFGLLGTLALAGKPIFTDLSPFWHLAAAAHGYFTLQVWSDSMALTHPSSAPLMSDVMPTRKPAYGK